MTRSVETILAQHAKWMRGEGGRRLVWADLDAKERADLSGADLRGAKLSGANLSGANLSPGLAIIQGPIRSDRFAFSLRACCFGEHVVVAGCRSFTIAEYRAHVADNYPGTPKAAETLAILDFLEARLTQTFAEWSTPNDA